MAKAKTKTPYVSKGERPNVSKRGRPGRTAEGERLINQVDAWFAGKRVVLGLRKKAKNDRITADKVWGRPGRFSMPTS